MSKEIHISFCLMPPVIQVKPVQLDLDSSCLQDFGPSTTVSWVTKNVYCIPSVLHQSAQDFYFKIRGPEEELCVLPRFLRQGVSARVPLEVWDHPCGASLFFILRGGWKSWGSAKQEKLLFVLFFLGFFPPPGLLEQLASSFWPWLPRLTPVPRMGRTFLIRFFFHFSRENETAPYGCPNSPAVPGLGRERAVRAAPARWLLLLLRRRWSHSTCYSFSPSSSRHSQQRCRHGGRPCPVMWSKHISSICWFWTPGFFWFLFPVAI